MNDSALALDATFILVLILCNGLLSMSEMALVSARRNRLQQEASRGSHSAEAALRLVGEPSGFLAAVQVGITLVGVLAGAFGGANIAEVIAASLTQVPLTFVAEHASAVALGLVVCGITFLSIVFGELIPKRVALARAETIAMLVARPIEWLALVSRPVVRILSVTTDTFVRLFGFWHHEAPSVTDDDLRSLVEEGTRTGVIEKEEETIIKRTLVLGDRTVEEIMTRRTDVIFLDADKPLQDILSTFREHRHSFFPVYEGHPDQILGVVAAKDLLAACASESFSSLRALVREPLYVSESLLALRVLHLFRSAGQHFAIVFDEHGAMTGIVSVIDLLESIVGDFPAPGDETERAIVRREDGSWLIDGAVSLDEVKALMTEVAADRAVEFREEIKTLGGFVMDEIGHIPVVSEHVTLGPWRFEVVDMDGRRVDKVLMSFAGSGKEDSEAPSQH